ncbi:Uncharacterised protein [Serratia quinivorans]|nr:Uncharacterised protein [Serratia quinivorans]
MIIANGNHYQLSSRFYCMIHIPRNHITNAGFKRIIHLIVLNESSSFYYNQNMRAFMRVISDTFIGGESNNICTKRSQLQQRGACSITVTHFNRPAP